MATIESYQGHRIGEEADFNEVLVMQLRRTPWFLLSILFHGLMVLILMLFSGKDDNLAQNRGPIEATLPPEEMVEEEMPPVPEETKEINPEEEVTEEPVVKDTEISDHNETDNNEEWEESKGEDNMISDKPFDGTQTNDAVGFGGGAGGAFGGRRGGKRNLRATGGGGAHRVVEAGLEWLKNHQSPEGHWDCDNFMANGDPKKGPLCDGRGQPQYDVGVSGLALLAFLGAGHTHREGAYKETVRKGLRWMVQQQDADGCFGPRTHHFTYNHGIAALAMAEAYGMTQTGIWKVPAQKGIDFVIAAQNPYKAWRYDVRPGENDVSVTGWMGMALKSAKLAGNLVVPDDPLKHAHDFIKEMTNDEDGRTGYTKKGERPVRPEGKETKFPAEESESLTAVGMLIRIFNEENPKDSAMLKAGAELLSKRLPIWDDKTGKIDMYYWYYGTLSMFQMGGDAWEQWNRKMLDAIIKTQRNDGNFKGSWDPIDPWGEDGGRVYSTAVMTMCLEVYYRYDRVFGTR
jgi:hypothetical protein